MRVSLGAVPAIMLWLAGATATGNAQTLSLGARAGTLGLGGEAAVGVARRLAFRAGLGLVPDPPRSTISGIRYDVDAPSPLTTIGADFLLTGGLRLFAGVLFGARSTAVTARLSQSTRIGDQTYTPEQAGSILGSLKSSSAAPYAGLGFGRYGKGRIGVTLDLGAAYLGENDLLLSATGPFRTDPTFQQELEKERVSVQEDLRRYTRWLPVLSLGLHVTAVR